MALEPGGYADKLGNRYEGRWVARQLLRVLNEDLLAVKVEPVGEEEDGVDLWIERPDGTRQAQQCKLRNRSSDSWSIADLRARGILAKMRGQLDRDSTNEFALVTAVPAVRLHDLCQSARDSSGSSEEFFKCQVEAIGEDRRRAFRQFCTSLGLDHKEPTDREKAYGYLRRFFVELWPDTHTSSEELQDFAGMLVQGKPATVVAVLAEYAQEHLRKRLTAEMLWAHLESRELRPRKLQHDDRILPRVQELRQQFRDSVHLIAGDLIHREETKRALDALEDAGVVVVHGRPGQGKSGVLYELTKHLDVREWPYLPVRLDRQKLENTTRQFGQDLELPESPVKCLEAIAGDKPAVLILDQLDAIRWTSRHSFNALEVCKSLVREVKGLRALGKQIGVVLACRTYDLENDPEIKGWLRTEESAEDELVRIEVGPLSEEAAASVADELGRDFTSLPERMKLMLRSPQHLAMWAHLVQSGNRLEFQNRVQLMREYWKDRIGELRRQGVSEQDALHVLTSLVNYMERTGHVSAPESVVSDTTGLNALRSCGLLQSDNGQITFSHQSYLDYQIARRVNRSIHTGGGTVIDWLGGKDKQTLFRREQLRQALCLLSEESPESFLETVRSLLGDAGVRFHLKHLVLEVVGQLESPEQALLAETKALVEDEFWKEHVLSVVYAGHAPYVRWLVKSGLIREWLESTEPRDSALWMLGSVSESLSDEVAQALEPFAESGDEWLQRILGCLSYRAEDDSDRMFELRLSLARNGVFREFVNWGKLAPDRALKLLEAAVSSWSSEDMPESRYGHRQSTRSRFEHWTKDDFDALKRASETLPEDTWRLFLPHVLRLAPCGDDENDRLELWLDRDRLGLRQGRELVPYGLVQLVISAGRALAGRDSAELWERTKKLRCLGSPVIKYILVEVYAKLSASMADQVLAWLLKDKSRLSVGTGENEPEWNPAARLVEAFSPHCSDAMFDRLEHVIVHYRSPREKRNAEYWLSTWKNGYYGDYWGRAQYFMMPALSPSRRSSSVVDLLGVLTRRFEHYPETRFLSGGQIRSGHVSSPLTGELARISDKAWLKLVTDKNIPEERGSASFRQIDDDNLAESSIPHFANDLQRVTARFPERFARLALEFPDDVHPQYKAAILHGLRESKPSGIPEKEKAEWRPAGVELLESVLGKFAGDSSQSYASGFCWLMRDRADETWSDASINQLIEYALSHEDPERVVSSEEGDSRESEASPHDLLNTALNCVRGSAVLAIGDQLRQHPESLERFREALETLVNDPHPAVRIAVTEACLPALGIEKDLAIRWFCRASAGDPRIAASRAGVYYFNCGMMSHYRELAPLVLRMLESDGEDVAEEGAMEVIARWLFHGYFEDKVAECLSGTTPQRKGAAKIAAQFVSHAEHFEKCAGLFDSLVSDPEPDVRQKLRAAVRKPDILSVPGGTDLVCRFVDSDAFRDDPTALIYGLKDYPGDLLPFAGLLLSICDQFTGPLSEATRDPSKGVMHDISLFLPIMVRLYEQADEQGDTTAAGGCLDALDAMFEKRVGIVYELARAID